MKQRGPRLVKIAVSVSIVLMVLTLVEDPKNNQPKIITPVAGGITAVVLPQRGANWGKGAIDRRFFREAYDSEQLLAGLGEEVRHIFETRPLVETVGRRVGAALHVEELGIVLWQQSDNVPFEQSRNVPLTVPGWWDGTRTTTDDAG